MADDNPIGTTDGAYTNGQPPTGDAGEYLEVLHDGLGRDTTTPPFADIPQRSSIEGE